MAKLTVVEPEPVPQPPKRFVLELSQEEVWALAVLTGGVGGTAHEIDEIYNLLDKDDKTYREGLQHFEFNNSGRTPRLDRRYE